MTLLVTVFAATICTAIWYKALPNDEMKISFLCLMYWGGSLMWFVDAIFEYIKLGTEFFLLEPSVLLNDLFLGLSAIALGLVIWIVYLMIRDPRGAVHMARKSTANNKSTQ